MYDLVFGRVPIDGPMVVRLDHACPLGLYMGQSFLGQWAPPPPIPTQTLNVAEERIYIYIYIISFCPIPFFFLFFCPIHNEHNPPSLLYVSMIIY